MSVGSRPRAGRSVRWQHPLGVIIVLVLGSGAAWGANITVNCPGESINVALATLDKAERNDVTITGDCVEEVVVEGFKELFLHGPATLQRPVMTEWPGKSALVIRDSKNVRITGLSFEGFRPDDYARPVVLIERSNVTIEDCTIHGNVSGGLDVQGQSDVQIVGTTVADNGTGIAASTSAHVQISNWWGDECFIEGNITGITASRNALVEVGLATIQNNRDAAVTASNGALVNLGGWGVWGAVTITNNGSGDPNDPKYPNNPLPAVQAADGGVIWIINPTAIEGNYGSGAHASRNGELYVCCGTTPDDTRISNNAGFGFDIWIGGGLYFWGSALVEGNVRGGIAVDSGEAFLNLGVLIRGNGDSTDPDSYGGLQVDDNATVYTAATVTDNNGPGVFVSAGATVFFPPGAVITGNRGYGVELEAAATATFMDGATVTGNRTFDLVCSSGSVAGAPQGMNPDIHKRRCPTWAHLRGYPEWLEDVIEP